jgi:hypothetical protein
MALDSGNGRIYTNPEQGNSSKNHALETYMVEKTVQESV